MKNSFLAIVRYGLKYFNMVSVDRLEFSGKILSLEDEHPHWRLALLVVEICICAPYSRATLERPFSQMNLIKTLLRNRLNNTSLNAILRIRISGTSLQQFHDNFVDICVNRWYNSANRRPNQCKRKKYSKRKSQTAKRPHFDMSAISSSSSDSSDFESDTSDNKVHGEMLMHMYSMSLILIFHVDNFKYIHFGVGIYFIDIFHPISSSSRPWHLSRTYLDCDQNKCRKINL